MRRSTNVIISIRIVEMVVIMENKLEYYNIIKDKIHTIKEEFPCLKDKTDDYAFSALAVKAVIIKILHYL